MKKTTIVLIIIIIILLYVSSTVIKKDSWGKYNNNPVFGNRETGTVFDPCVIQDSNGIYKMYVSCRDKDNIAVTESTDGINWSPLKCVLENDKNTGWEDRVNRATVIYRNNKYYMWYTGQCNNVSKIGYSESLDRI